MSINKDHKRLGELRPNDILLIDQLNEFLNSSGESEVLLLKNLLKD